MEGLKRCGWAKDPLEQVYHDLEWGTPEHNDRKLFEMLILEGMQAGLSWLTILKKRAHMRVAFDAFDYEKIAAYSGEKTALLLEDVGIIRNKAKINALVRNASAFIEIQKEYDSFDRFLWAFVEGKPIVNHWKDLNEVPVTTAVSDKLSGALKKKGFSFVGSTICYSYMQAIGMVNDHLVDCWRHGAKEV